MFIEVPSDSFFVGTANHDERTRDFRPHVTWNIEHLAGQTNTQAHKLSLVKKMKPIGKKYLGDRGYDWEVSVDRHSAMVSSPILRSRGHPILVNVH